MAPAVKDGRDLERAVLLIEKTILDEFGISKGRITLEPRKRVVSPEGVPDEIDLYVRVEHAPGYESVVLFECKDRSTPSDKADVETLRGKMERANASGGILVARGFTRGARALATRYSTMKLLLATEVPVAAFLEQYEASYFQFRNVRFDVLSKHDLAQGNPEEVPVTFRGSSTNLDTFARGLAMESASARIEDEPWPPDPYFGQSYVMKPGEFAVGGFPALALTVQATIEAIPSAPIRVVGFEVEGRGKVVQFVYRWPNGEEHFVAMTAASVTGSVK
jgi:Restriction endonuclease